MLICEICNISKNIKSFHRYGHHISDGCKDCLEKEFGEIKCTHLPEYNIWQAMHSRCYDKTNPEYHRYGGRGISICARWLKSFWNFLTDLKRRDSEDHWIERVDNDGNYEPGNCIWLHKTLQALNRSTNHVVNYNGMRKTISELSDITGLNYQTIRNRSKNGCVEENLIRPVYESVLSVHDLITYKGETNSIKEWSKITGLGLHCLYHRHKKGDKGGNLFRPAKPQENIYVYKGMSYNLVQLSEESGLSQFTLRNRIHQQGLSVEEAMERPLEKLFDYNGEKLSLRQISNITGICFSTLSYRARKGYSSDDLIKITHEKKSSSDILSKNSS